MNIVNCNVFSLSLVFPLQDYEMVVVVDVISKFIIQMKTDEQHFLWYRQCLLKNKVVLASLSVNEILNHNNSHERQRAAIFVDLFIMPNTVEQASEFVSET